MLGRTILLFGLALAGIVKAGATVAIGIAVHAPPTIVSLVAALWITGPPTVAYVMASCRRSAAAP